MSYRVMSSKLGYSCPESSWKEAMKLKIDLVGADAGSMDPGPYYLGSGESYMKPDSLKRDFRMLLKAALMQDCPLLIGSLGLSGSSAGVVFMLDIVKEIFEEEAVIDIKVAVIGGDVDNTLLIGHVDELRPLGKMPPVTASMVENSVLVAQMGIAPYMTALNEGARVVLAGRSCDVAIFAADAVRRGFDPGLAFQAAHILECGAIACDPGSASDYLVAEFREDDSVVFTPPNPDRKATVYSIAAHALYEESHPSLQYYPEGVLVMENTEYFQDGPRSAGIRKPQFVSGPLSVKIEGSECIGRRYVSFIPLQESVHESDDPFLDEHLVYGLNAVERAKLLPDEKEIGILLKVNGRDSEKVQALATVIKGFMLHFGYPGRTTTAGNLAFPMSPSEILKEEDDGSYTVFVIAGTREPRFIEQKQSIFESVESLAKEEYPDNYAECSVEVILSDVEHPMMFLETVADTTEEALSRHDKELTAAQKYADKSREEFTKMDAGDAYVWSVFHLWDNAELIRKNLFPITLYDASGARWDPVKELRPVYEPVGISDYSGSLDAREVDVIEEVEHEGSPMEVRPLKNMVQVLRSKDAGVNTITYDIFFKSEDEYRQALDSNAFTKKSIAQTLGIPEGDMIGTYKVDLCYAIKISRYREVISGVPGSPDGFGAQQHMKIELMEIPIYA
jgi:hypothetical protein